jgi:hypothetical protein
MRIRILLCLLLAAPARTAEPDLQSLSLDSARGNAIALAGRDSWHQLLVTGTDAHGRQRDVTRFAKFQASPAGIVAVDDTGLVTPLKEGTATLDVSVGGLKASAKVVVSHLVQDLPVSFANQVVPIFTKFGCNAGGCHGKAGGQNGFALSLLGFEPEDDYEYLVKENRGRRLMPSAPDQSLLLLKATGILAHGGGKRIELDSPYYALVRRWIEQGMPQGTAKDPVVTRIEVLPKERLLHFEESQQLAVLAHLSDGSTQDVTRLSQFEANEMGMAEAGSTGLVTAKRRPGTVAIMARYQTHVDTFRATIPLGKDIAQLPPLGNFIDEHVFAQLKTLGLPPSGLCDDGTFLRRATIDIAGRLPTLEETKAFLADASKDKHARLVDRLLASEDYAYYFAGKWSAVLRNRRGNPGDDARPTNAFHAWIKDGLHQNKPFDQFVREVITVQGEEIKDPPVVWFREIREASAQMEDVAQLFLGQRVACAKCHHHPMEKWSQHDYWSMVAFFTRVEVKDPPPVKSKKGEKPMKEPVRVLHKPGIAFAQHPRTKQTLKPSGLGAEPVSISQDQDPRHALVDWMTTPDNPYFARTLVNRYWKHFFGRGLVDPEDDIRGTNPATNPALLDALAKSFVDSKYDLKKLVRTICLSSTYRLSAVPNADNASDRQNYSHFFLRRINAEVLLDAIDVVTGSETAFKGAPPKTRAVQLPDNQFDSYFLSIFGRPDSASPCECERSGDSTLAQSLYLFNSEELLEKIRGKKSAANPAKKETKVTTMTTETRLASSGGRIQELLKDKRPDADKIRDLYLLAFSREPSADELRTTLSYLERKRDDMAGGYEDVLWALINTKEFMFNH